MLPIASGASEELFPVGLGFVHPYGIDVLQCIRDLGT